LVFCCRGDEGTIFMSSSATSRSDGAQSPQKGNVLSYLQRVASSRSAKTDLLSPGAESQKTKGEGFWRRRRDRVEGPTCEDTSLASATTAENEERAEERGGRSQPKTRMGRTLSQLSAGSINKKRYLVPRTSVASTDLPIHYGVRLLIPFLLFEAFMPTAFLSSLCSAGPAVGS